MVSPMRILRMLSLALLVSTAACVVTPARSSHSMPPPPPGDNQPATEGNVAPPHRGGATLRGVVVDAATHAPISRAAIDIVIENVGSYTQQTDTNGVFEMNDVPGGKYNLRVRRDGYNVWQTAGVWLGDGTDQQLNVALVHK
jgi:hypothetical protein